MQGAAMEWLRRFYQRNPEAYIEKRLGAKLTDKQREICRAIIKHKRVIVLASHGVGKSALAAMLVNWFFDCFRNSLTITTAPTARQVNDVLWKEVRKRRRGPGLLPKSPRMEVSADWFAVGMTATNPDAFQGGHAEFVFLVFDEAVGVKPGFYDAAEGIMSSPDSYFLAICNPTDSSSKIKELADSGDYHVITISALDHPNVQAGLRGDSTLPFPGAVSLGYIEKAIRNWAVRVTQNLKHSDVEWPPKSGFYFRPGPLFESRVLGRWPSQATNNVYTDAHWLGLLEQQPIDEHEPLEVGCDVARYGDDFTSIFIRRGRTVLEHVTYNGNSLTHTSGEIMQIMKRHLGASEAIESVAIKIDDDGVGGGVSDILLDYGFNVVRVRSGTAAFEPEMYTNRRSELWFATRDRAEEFMIDASRLGADSKKLLKVQLMAVKYKLNGRGQRVIEDKDDLKKRDRLNRSPDDADALNLCFAPASAGGMSVDERGPLIF